MSIRYVVTNFNYNNKSFKGLMLFDEHKLIRMQAVSDKPNCVGGIYAGLVSKISKDKSYCFVTISKDESVYLPLSRDTKPYYVKKQSKDDALHEGDIIAVQIEKSAIKTKPATATIKLSIAGKYVAITSNIGELAVSSKLDKPTKTDLKNSLQHLTSDNYGIIVRTAAADSNIDEIETEITTLTNRFNIIVEKIKSADLYSVIQKPIAYECKFLLEEGFENIDKIVTDIPTSYSELNTFCAEKGISDKLSFYDDKYDLSKLYSISTAVDKATSRIIHLKNGGSIVIDQTESLTAIDVNMASGVKTRDKEENINYTNLLAAEEIAYQLKLRNISGIIIVDFIDMKDDSTKNNLISKMKDFVRNDKIGVNVVDITPLGLMELTRKRVINSLKEQLK